MYHSLNDILKDLQSFNNTEAGKYLRKLLKNLQPDLEANSTPEKIKETSRAMETLGLFIDNIEKKAGKWRYQILPAKLSKKEESKQDKPNFDAMIDELAEKKDDFGYILFKIRAFYFERCDFLHAKDDRCLLTHENCREMVRKSMIKPVIIVEEVNYRKLALYDFDAFIKWYSINKKGVFNSKLTNFTTRYLNERILPLLRKKKLYRIVGSTVLVMLFAIVFKLSGGAIIPLCQAIYTEFITILMLWTCGESRNPWATRREICVNAFQLEAGRPHTFREFENDICAPLRWLNEINENSHEPGPVFIWKRPDKNNYYECLNILTDTVLTQEAKLGIENTRKWCGKLREGRKQLLLRNLQGYLARRQLLSAYPIKSNRVNPFDFSYYYNDRTCFDVLLAEHLSRCSTNSTKELYLGRKKSWQGFSSSQRNPDVLAYINGFCRNNKSK